MRVPTGANLRHTASRAAAEGGTSREGLLFCRPLCAASGDVPQGAAPQAALGALELRHPLLVLGVLRSIASSLRVGQENGFGREAPVTPRRVVWIQVGRILFRPTRP